LWLSPLTAELRLQPFPQPQKLVHNGRAEQDAAVNNFSAAMLRRRISLELLHGLEPWPPTPAGEQPVHINSLKKSQNGLCCSQFIERTEQAAAWRHGDGLFQDNPG